MGISLISLYNDFLTLLNKNNGEYVSPEEFVSYVKLANEEMYNEFLGRKNLRKTVYGNNSITDNRLNVFRTKSGNIPYDPETKEITVPTDCKHIRSVTDNYGNPILYQDDNRFNMLRKDSTVNLRDTSFYKEEGLALEVLTEMPISHVVIHYLRDPKEPKLPYTIVDREIVFDTVGVVDLEWDKDQTGNILSRVLVWSGVTLRDGMMTQIGRIKQAEE